MTIRLRKPLFPGGLVALDLGCPSSKNSPVGGPKKSTRTNIQERNKQHGGQCRTFLTAFSQLRAGRVHFKTRFCRS